MSTSTLRRPVSQSDRKRIARELARRITHHRTTLEITHLELSRMVGKSIHTVIQWGSARRTPRLFDLHALSRVFGCTVAELVGGDEQ